MSIECGECERDLRGGHDESCSRYKPDPARFARISYERPPLRAVYTAFVEEGDWSDDEIAKTVEEDVRHARILKIVRNLTREECGPLLPEEETS
jgi:hypothetical protein